MTPAHFDQRWKIPLFNAGNLALYSKTTPDGTPYTPFASAENFQLGLERAFQHAAASLMFSQFENRFWTNPNPSTGIPWTILVLPEDSVPPLLVLVVLVLCALGCVVLGLANSFRKRWDAVFSVGSLYWYCKMVGGIRSYVGDEGDGLITLTVYRFSLGGYVHSQGRRAGRALRLGRR